MYIVVINTHKTEYAQCLKPTSMLKLFSLDTHPGAYPKKQRIFPNYLLSVVVVRNHPTAVLRNHWIADTEAFSGWFK